jgi:hypothetical protein
MAVTALTYTKLRRLSGISCSCPSGLPNFFYFGQAIRKAQLELCISPSVKYGCNWAKFTTFVHAWHAEDFPPTLVNRRRTVRRWHNVTDGRGRRIKRSTFTASKISNKPSDKLNKCVCVVTVTHQL